MKCGKKTDEADKKNRGNGGPDTPGYHYSYVASLEMGTGPYKNGIELCFDRKPGECVRGRLKENGFRWHNQKGVWYAVATPERVALAEQIVKEGLCPVKPEPVPAASQPVAAPAAESVSVAEPTPVAVQKTAEKTTTLVRKRTKPAGVNVATKFRVPDGTKNKRERQLVSDALSVISKVHGVDSALPDIRVNFISASTTAEARLVLVGKKPVQLDVSKKPDVHPLDVIHEVGHYIDFALGDKIAPHRERILRAIKKSKGYKDLITPLPPQVDVVVTETDGTSKVEKYPRYEIAPDLKRLTYMTSPHELLARAYAQYISTKADFGKDYMDAYTTFRVIKKVTPKSKKTQITTYFRAQWEEDDFAPIAEEFDKLFASLGWIK